MLKPAEKARSGKAPKVLRVEPTIFGGQGRIKVTLSNAPPFLGEVRQTDGHGQSQEVANPELPKHTKKTAHLLLWRVFLFLAQYQ